MWKEDTESVDIETFDKSFTLTCNTITTITYINNDGENLNIKCTI